MPKQSRARQQAAGSDAPLTLTFTMNLSSGRVSATILSGIQSFHRSAEMNHWLLLADPKTYGFGDLMKEGKAVWDGISGNLAQKHMRQFKKGDRALIYHTAPDKAVVGSARISSNPYPDSNDAAGKLVVVGLRPESKLANAVPLEALRNNPGLSGMTFLKIQRIAVSPVSKAEYDEILRMAGK
jgi:predicted RNA-binding protein with PUA-like domain